MGGWGKESEGFSSESHQDLGMIVNCNDAGLGWQAVKMI